MFLSIGYATCHWCHVMEHESFEDPVTAQALNEAFVPIKVDREERPDVDGIYMSAVIAATGGGGWPLTALLTPDTREPFWVGTYLPRESRGGRMGVRDLAASVSRHWRENADGVRRSAAELAGAVRSMADLAPGNALQDRDLDAVSNALARRFDPEFGGFGMAPKFPTPHHVLFLLRRASQTRDGRLVSMALATLRAIRRGGIDRKANSQRRSGFEPHRFVEGTGAHESHYDPGILCRGICRIGSRIIAVGAYENVAGGCTAADL